MIVEMLTIGVCIYLFSRICKLGGDNSKINELENQNKKQKNFILVLVLVIFMLIILSEPTVLNQFSFINIQEGGSYTSRSRNEEMSAGTLPSLALTWFRLLFPIFWIKTCKDIYLRTKNKTWVYIATIVPIFSLLFFSGLSRSSILLPALSLVLILGRTFPGFRRKMNAIILSTAAFSVSLLTIYKSFGTSSINEGIDLMDIKWLSNTLEAYFGGVYNVAIAIDAKASFFNNININTLLSDLFRSWMGLGEIFRGHLSTSHYFNIELYGRSLAFDQVVPTIGSSYMLFGIFGSMVLTIVIVWLICLFEYKFKNENTIELAYLYGFSAIQSAFNLPGNFIILCSYLLNTFLPLYIIFKLNQRIILKQ